jgi:hypothetical protein
MGLGSTVVFLGKWASGPIPAMLIPGTNSAVAVLLPGHFAGGVRSEMVVAWAASGTGPG